VIHFLKLKRTKKVRKKSGKTATRALSVKKNYKMGKVVSEETISVTKPILVCGRHASGKTRWLKRLYDNANEVWAKQQGEALFFNSTASITEWKDQDVIKSWWNGNNLDKPWDKLSTHRREKALINYVGNVWTVIFIDNLDKISGKKAEIIKIILSSSKSRIWVASSIAENRIAPSLRAITLKTKPQQFILSSPIAYDATNTLVMTACIILIMTGHIEAAIIVGFFRVLSRGIFSTKQQ
jgi:hypothetical protein